MAAVGNCTDSHGNLKIPQKEGIIVHGGLMVFFSLFRFLCYFLTTVFPSRSAEVLQKSVQEHCNVVNQALNIRDQTFNNEI